MGNWTGMIEEGTPVSASARRFATGKSADAAMPAALISGGRGRLFGAKPWLVSSFRVRRFASPGMTKKKKNGEDPDAYPATGRMVETRGFSHGVEVDGPGKWIVLAARPAATRRACMRPTWPRRSARR